MSHSVSKRLPLYVVFKDAQEMPNSDITIVVTLGIRFIPSLNNYFCIGALLIRTILQARWQISLGSSLTSVVEDAFNILIILGQRRDFN